MPKISLEDVGNILTAAPTINQNNQRIEQVMENMLSRDGAYPNEMNDDLDMNFNQIYNLPKATSNTGPLRPIDLGDYSVPIIFEGDGTTFPTKLAAELASVPDTWLFFRTAGYAVVGDGGHALYKRVGSEPTHPAKVQTLDGAWWEHSDNDVRAEQLNRSLPDTLESAQAMGKTAIFPSGTFAYGGTITIDRLLTVKAHPSTVFEYTSTTGNFWDVISSSDFRLDGGQFLGRTDASDGNLLRIYGPAPYGHYFPVIQNVRFTYGYNQLAIQAAFYGSFLNLNFSQANNVCILQANTRAPLLGRNTFAHLRFEAKPGAANSIGIYHTSGSDNHYSDMYSYNMQTDYFLAPIAGTNFIGNQVFTTMHFQGSTTNFYFQKTSTDLAANFVITGGILYGANNILSDGVSGWLHDLTISNLQCFPGYRGSGAAVSIDANPVKISSLVVDGGNPDGSGDPLPGSGGINIGDGSFFWHISDCLFTALEYNVFNPIPTEQTITVYNTPGYSSVLDGYITIPASPAEYRAGPTHETFIFTKSTTGTFGISLAGNTIASGTGTGAANPITIRLRPHQQLFYSYSGSTPAVFISRDC